MCGLFVVSDVDLIHRQILSHGSLTVITTIVVNKQINTYSLGPFTNYVDSQGRKGRGQGFCKISTPCPQGGEGRCSNLSSKLMVVEKIRTHHYHPQICHHEQCFRYVNYCRKKIKTFWKPKGMSSFIETNLMTTNFLGAIGVFTGNINQMFIFIKPDLIHRHTFQQQNNRQT